MVRMPPRAAKILVVVACSLGMAGVATGQSFSVNYRGQSQEDLTCMQANTTLATGETIPYRNDPSTNCFGFPSLQFDDLPVQGGKPNSFTIDWSLMVDELQMQDDDRLHFHLPGFTGGHNTFGIMGPAVDIEVKGISYTPNFRSEFVTGDQDHRADFGALVGIWGISCGTEENIYMDRAKVDNLRTAEWDPATELLKVVIKGQRYGPVAGTGRHDGYTGPFGNANLWNAPAAANQGQAVTTQNPICATNRACNRGAHMQAMEYSREGPQWANPVAVAAAAVIGQEAIAVTDINDQFANSLNKAPDSAIGTMNYKNDGYITAPGARVCGIYVDSTKLYRGQRADQIQNGLGPLPPFGGIGKNWYKIAYMRRFTASRCTGGFPNAAGLVVRPGMNPETCAFDKTRAPTSLSNFWQVPFDGDTERIVGYQFTTTSGMLPVNNGADATGSLNAPSFAYAVAKGTTTGPNLDNCITVSLIPTVTIVSGSSSSAITIEGLTGATTSNNDNLPLYSDGGCNSEFKSLVGSNGDAIRNFRPARGGGVGSPDELKQAYRPFGQAHRLSNGKMWKDVSTTLGAPALGTGFGGTGGLADTAAMTFPTLHGVVQGWGYFDDADWHTWAKQGTVSGITTGDPTSTPTGTLAGRANVGGSKLQSPIGAPAVANGKAQWQQVAGDQKEGRLTVNLAPGYFIQKGELLVFSFKLQNSGTVQPQATVTVSASGSYCQSDNGFCDGVSDGTLSIVRQPVAVQGRVLETRAPYFRDAIIHQSTADPNSLTTLFVTLRTNVDLYRAAAGDSAKLSISGLCGFQTGTNIVLYQNQKSGGMPFDDKYPVEAVRNTDEMPGLAATDSSINSIISHLAEYDATSGTLKIDLGGKGLLYANKYGFAFQLTTVKTANAACRPQISSTGGNNVMPPQDMSATNVGLVNAPAFTTLKIGQVTTRPNVPNFICVTLRHNFEFFTDSAVTGSGNTQQQAGYVESKITISGLTGTASVSKPAGGDGYALAYCPTELPYFDDRTTQHTSTQFQPDASTEFGYKRFASEADPTCISAGPTGVQTCVPGNPYTPADVTRFDGVLDRSMAGRSWFGGQTEKKDHFTWDQRTGTAVLTVDPLITSNKITEPMSPKGGIPKNAEIVFALVLRNPSGASDCITPTFEASGGITQGPVPMTITKTGRALQDGEMDGDACPLKVYAPGFLVKTIVQSTAVTDEDNTITVSIRSNVDFSSTPSGTASFITIAGLTGSTTSSGDLGIRAPSHRFSPRFEKNQGAWTQSTGTMVLKLDPGVNGVCSPPTVWAAGDFYSSGANSVVQAPFVLGGSDSGGLSTASTTAGATGVVTGGTPVSTAGLLATSAPSACVKAGFLYVFAFVIHNPLTEQPNGPTVTIGGQYWNSESVQVTVPAANIDPPISDQSDKIPMAISNTLLTTAKIGQLFPAPGATNVICVTLKTSKDMESTASQLLSTITISGLTGFNADAQDLKLFQNDGITPIVPQTGDPQTQGAYAVGNIFKARNDASSVENIAWVRYAGSTIGDVSMQIVGAKANSLPGTNVQYFQKNVDHKFCFLLRNPDSPMACKDVTITTVNKGISKSVKAKLDLTTTIEDYPSQSACPGYVAPIGFVVRNWKSSSNITSDVAVIKMELATNFELKAADKFTVSGLTSYTKSCPGYPCDVGITVSRVDVQRTFGKPYVNGRRNVMGYGVSDAGALAADRQKFAVAIQSYDLTGKKDDGSFTSTFGDLAKWGVEGDTEASASVLTFTIAKEALARAADITTATEATMFEVVFQLTNRPDPVAAPDIKIGILSYDPLSMNTGAVKPKYGLDKLGAGGMDITYTSMKTIYGGESLILTLPQFKRDSNGMLFGITSSPSNAFNTYSTWGDWKAYGTDEDYARAFFTNGWSADGISAKSGDSGQTGERWNFPNVNAKITTDADFNHDTGVFVLDSEDPGVGVNKDYWYAATEDNLYEGRVTPVAYQGTKVPGVGGVRTNPPTFAGITNGATAQMKPGRASLPEATADYYLDNGEALDPVMTATTNPEYLGTVNVNGLTTHVPTNSYRRPSGLVLTTAAQQFDAQNNIRTSQGSATIGTSLRFNNYPAPLPADVYKPVDNYAGTPPFKGIPAKYQPSRRDNFYKGMLMKCWIGASLPPRGAPTDYSENLVDMGGIAVATAATQYRPGTGVTELLPPPLRSVPSAFGDVLVSRVGPANTDAPGSYLSADDIANAQAFGKAGVSRVLETRVIQASFRQIDYIPRKLGGCHFSSLTTAGLPQNKAAGNPTLSSAATFGQVGCQDEVPGYPAIVRLESPFSRALDPDTLCYIQRKAHVGVYTGMTAMIGQTEYTIKQGAANLYTVSQIAKDMKDRFGNAVDRKVPRSYSTESPGINAQGLRGADNVVGFFRDGAGLSGQPYTIYSQLELVAKRGSTVALGETVTISIPTSAQIMPPADLSKPVTPSIDPGATDSASLASKIKISHVLLVPLSPACSIVGAYGVPSACQANNGKGGVFDLMLSRTWPYAFDSENKNDITGYGMTVFGGQSTVIKSMADKYSQDLPIRPLEGAHSASATRVTATVTATATIVSGILDPNDGTYANPGILNVVTVGGRLQTSTSTGKATFSAVDAADALKTWPASASSDANAQVVPDFTVRKELDAVSFGGNARPNTVKAPRMPNSPITLIHGACGTLADVGGQPATLPYAVCLSLSGGVAHNQELFANTGATATTIFDEIGRTPDDDTRIGASGVSFVAADAGAPGSIGGGLFRPKVQQDKTTVVAGPQDITGAIGQLVTPVVADRHAESKAMGSAPETPNYGSWGPVAVAGTAQRTAFFEEAGDNLGLGAYIIVGVYKTGTSDRFAHSRSGNKGKQALGTPLLNDMASNLVVQRYLGTSRETIPLASVPAGLIGGDIARQPTGGYPAPAGSVPRYQARIGGGYSIGRFGYGVDSILRVRSDMTSMAKPTGMPWVDGSAAAPSNTAVPLYATLKPGAAADPGDADWSKGQPLSSFTAVPHMWVDPTTGLAAAGAQPTGHSLDVTTPTIQEALVFGRTTLPLPQVIHTAKGVADSVVTRNMLSRGTCGVRGGGNAAARAEAANTDEACLAASFNTGLPFSRNVYIEEGQDVYIISSVFDTLIQRPEPPRKHLGLTVNGWRQNVSPGYYGQPANTRLGDTSIPTDPPNPPAVTTSAAYFPGSLRVGGALSINAVSLTAPNAIPPALPVDFNAHDQRFGIIQTLGTPKPKGTVNDANSNTWTTAPGAAAAADHRNQYGFDEDFRLYSVLGPFMRPARIKDVYDGSKIVSAVQSKFPGILTIHNVNGAVNSEISPYTGCDADNNPPACTRANMPIVTENTAPTAVVGPPNVPAHNSWNNNALYSMAPVVGTSYALNPLTNLDTGRLSQFHRYAEADKILTFCNPMQGYLNNAPGSAIMSDISDSPIALNSDGLLPAPTANTGITTPQVVAGVVTPIITPITILRQATSNGKEEDAPSVWNVPRRHHLCRKMVTGNPLLTARDMELGSVATGGAGFTSFIVAGNDYSLARARFTESVQFNNVLNQEPSPNMRGMITFVEPTVLPASTGGPTAGVCVRSGKKLTGPLTQAGCDKFELQTGANSRVRIPSPVPDWFTFEGEEVAFDTYPNFGPTALIAGTGGTVTGDMIKDIADGDLRYGYNWYDKKLMLGPFVRTKVSAPPQGQSPVTYTVLHKATRNVTADDLPDAKFNTARRLLATFCPDGFEARLVAVGKKLTSDSCKCKSQCGAAEASCDQTMTGTTDWNQVLLLERTCRDATSTGIADNKSTFDRVGAIVGGVLGGFFGALLLLLLLWFCCCRKKKQQPEGRPPAPVPQYDNREAAPAKALAPVYLPQPYPALPEQFAPAPMPAYPEYGVVQPTGQPTLYSSMQGVPFMHPMSGSYPAVPPPMSGSYPAPYGVVQQPMY